MPWAIIAVTTLLSFSDIANGITKIWKPTVDYEDPVNWDTGYVPSSVDIVMFQAETAVPVVLPSVGISVCEMLLPLDGQLILEPNASIIISSSSKDTGGCIGQTVKFKRNTPMEWVDPDNWSSENTDQATPHVERIPCVHDTVQFSPDNSFSVTVPDIPIYIGAMEFGYQSFDQNELNEFLLTDVGDQELKSSSPNNDVSITLIDTNCDDRTGCECGTQQLLDQVCKVASKRCDPKLGCISPVKPIGHCCWICGAYYLIDFNPKYFTIKELYNTLEEDIEKIQSTFQKYQISVHVSKLLNGKLQFVLTSTKYVDEINEIAENVHSVLISYIKRGMNITNVQMFSSGLSYTVDGMTYGQIALTTCVIVISCMLAIIFYYTNDWKSHLFGSGSGTGAVFVKFENYTNDVELINEDRRLQRKSSFDNPTYGAVENLAQTQAFSGILSHTGLTAEATIPNDKTDVELKETRKHKIITNQ